MSIREKFLTAAPRREPVPLPGLGCTVYAQAMSARELVAYQAASTGLRDAAKAAGEAPDGTLLTCLLIARTIRDDGGRPVFTDNDVKALADADGDAVNKLADAAAKVNGIGAREDAAAEKKSPPPSGDSGSASLETSETDRTPTGSSTV